MAALMMRKRPIETMLAVAIAAGIISVLMFYFDYLWSSGFTAGIFIFSGLVWLLDTKAA